MLGAPLASPLQSSSRNSAAASRTVVVSHKQRCTMALQARAMLPPSANRLPARAFTAASRVQQRPQRAVQTAAVALEEDVFVQQNHALQLELAAIRQGGAFSTHYTMGELLGQGTHAKVHAVTDKATGEQYAVKVLRKHDGRKDRTAQIEMEVQHCWRLQASSHASRLHAVLEDEHHVYLVQELCCGGDISDLLAVNPGGLSEAEAATVIRCVLEFLAAAHAQDICYGDIKPANFVLRSLYPSIAHLLDPSKPKGELRVTAIDFGCCQAVSSEDCLPDSRITGTPMYMAPEILEGCAGKEVDVWAAGVMLYQLLSDRFPFWNLEVHQMDALGPHALRDGILHGVPLFGRDPWFTRVHPSAQDLICAMLRRDVGSRITAAEALQHPWFEHALSGH